MGYIYRFVTAQAVLRAAREKSITDRRLSGYRGPVGAMKLDMRDTIKAFLDYWDGLGTEGWIYSGTVEYPELPFGGVYCFRKPKDTPKIKKSGMRAVETLDEQPLEEYEHVEENNDAEDLMFDITNEKTKEELFQADAGIVNEVLFRQRRVLNDDDPDRTSDVMDELEKSQEQIPQKEKSKVAVRHQLYKVYETENKGKNAIWNGKETKGFKEFLDMKRSQYDPYYKDYNTETGEIALKDEKETLEFKSWLKKQREE